MNFSTRSRRDIKAPLWDSILTVSMMQSKTDSWDGTLTSFVSYGNVRMQSHAGVFTRRKAEYHETERERCIYVSLSLPLISALRRVKTLT